MALDDLPSTALLRQLLDYDEATGALIWRQVGLGVLPATGIRSAEWAMRRHNNMLAGRRAGSYDGEYLRVRIQKKLLKAHRVAWAIYYGDWPCGVIDHINGNSNDNRIANLRCVSHGENMRNRKRSSGQARHGLFGVYYEEKYAKWRASISFERKQIYLGQFATHAEAVDARRCAERELGYHANHGRLSGP